MKESTVITRLRGMVAADADPTLSTTELTSLVRQARVADPEGNVPEDVVAWEPDTSYVVGDRVTDLNGHAYVCTEEGNSGASEPAWDETVSDGTVVWERDGESVWTPSYDVNYAAVEGWSLKAAKAASMISFTADGARFNREQYIANCLTMQEHYRARMAATVAVAPRRRRRAFGQ